MSEWLNAKNIEIADPGTGFNGTVYNLAKEGIAFKADSHILDIIKSDSEEPYRRISVGEGIEIKAVLEGVDIRPADRDGTMDIFDQKDVRFSVMKSDNIEYHYFLTNCILEKQWELAFKGGEIGYVPITIKSTSSSQLDILKETDIYGEDPGLSPDYFNLLTEAGETITGFIKV